MAYPKQQKPWKGRCRKMDKMILILKLSLAAGAVMAVILLVYEILLSIDFVKG